MKHRWHLVPWFAWLAVASGCPSDPYSDVHTTKAPTASEVEGAYRLKEQTITPEGLAALQGKECVIELYPDGIFSARNVPPFGSDGPTSHFFSRLVSGEGTWKVDTAGAIGSRPIWGVHLNSPSVEMAPASLTGDKPPYRLMFTIGDPDQGDVLIFEKIE